MSTIRAIDVEKATRMWEALPEFRWLTTQARFRQNVLVLQRAWRCMETGEIEWRSIPMNVVSEEEFENLNRT